MPLYEYKCNSCGDVFEVIQKFSDDPLAVHDSGCGGAVERLLSLSGFRLKGTGWYATDYARKGGNGANGDSKKEAKPDSSPTKSESKSESKDTPAKAESTPATTSVKDTEK